MWLILVVLAIQPGERLSPKVPHKLEANLQAKPRAPLPESAMVQDARAALNSLKKQQAKSFDALQSLKGQAWVAHRSRESVGLYRTDFVYQPHRSREVQRWLPPGRHKSGKQFRVSEFQPVMAVIATSEFQLTSTGYDRQGLDEMSVRIRRGPATKFGIVGIVFPGTRLDDFLVRGQRKMAHFHEDLLARWRVGKVERVEVRVQKPWFELTTEYKGKVCRWVFDTSKGGYCVYFESKNDIVTTEYRQQDQRWVPKFCRQLELDNNRNVKTSTEFSFVQLDVDQPIDDRYFLPLSLPVKNREVQIRDERETDEVKWIKLDEFGR